jgi:predicted dithiol-disulfide oxidoreductase (DUF899 family)
MQHAVVSHNEWVAARKQFLAKEKEFTRLRDELSRQRRELPWEKVDKNYTFEGPKGKVTLAELFGERSQLIVYHFMLGPEMKEGCPGCSFVADHFDGFPPVHLQARDVAFTAVSRGPLAQINAYKQRMGWSFPWVSSNQSDFNYDYQVSLSPAEKSSKKTYYNYQEGELPEAVSEAERPGLSVFYKNEKGEIFHTYSTYARGLDILLGTYNFLDMVPKGRDEEGIKPHPMAWVRHHDKYEHSGKVAECCHS